MARVAIVTGGTRGIGEAISIALRDLGLQVAANYAGNEERAREFTERTGIKAYKWDVSDFDACQANFEHGLLRLTFPKSEAAKPRRIQIEGGSQPAMTSGKGKS